MPKVLLVEDDNNLREIFQMRLQAEGYNAMVAADGEEGLVTAMKEKPDLIIADVMMPKLSGFEMVENLRSAPEMKDTKVIMMTALGQSEDQARGEKLGVVKYLVKSQVTLEDFARVVQEVLGPGDPSASAAAQQVTSSPTNSQGSEGPMQDDTQNNPAPSSDSGMPAPADASAPAADASQQSSADEQSVVQDQINQFAGSDAAAPAEPAAPAADAPAEAPADMGAPAMPPMSEPPAAPAEPPASTGGEESPAAPSGDQSGQMPPADPTANAL